MSNSSLVTYTRRSPHYGYPTKANGYLKTGRYGYKIDKICIHHTGYITTNVSQTAAAFCGSREASANYGVCKKQVGLFVDEANAAYHCGNKQYNCRSIGIEFANDGGAATKWHVADQTIATGINLIADICKRNGIKELNYTGTLSGNLIYHSMVSATVCCGPYLKSKMKYIQDEVNKKLGASEQKTVEKKWTDYKTPFTVRITADDLYIRRGPAISYAREVVDGSYFIKKGVYTIIKCQKGGDYYWGKLKSSTSSSPRWIALDTEWATFVKEVSAVAATTTVKTPQDKMCEWAKKIADGNQYRYKSWESNDEKTKQCPICHGLTGKYKGWNCIGFAFAAWRHGAGAKSACSCSVISDPKWNAMLKGSDAEALKIAQDRIGIKDVKVIRNGGKVIPTSMLQKGDIISFFNGSNYYHTALYVGNGKCCDITSSRSPAVKYNVSLYDGLKVAVRYTGK